MWLDWGSWAGGLFSICIMTILVKKNLDFRKFLQMELKGSNHDAYLSDGQLACISVVIPARNEERFIESAIRHALASNYSPLEVILVNDRSEDGTQGIMDRLEAEDTRVKVLSLSELPQGWTGKAHALFIRVVVWLWEISWYSPTLMRS